MKKTRQVTEKGILRFSMLSCAIFVLLEIIISITTRSQSVLMDAVYDASELVMIFITLTILPLLYRPLSEKHPYGFSQLESLVIILKGFMMLSVTGALLINNIQIMITGGHTVDYTNVAIFELVISIISFLVVIILRQQNKHFSSPIIATEINGWLIDAVTSLGMAASFFIPTIFNSQGSSIILYLDQIVAILLCLSILPYPIKLLVSTFKDIFLFAPEEETVNAIKDISETFLPKQFSNNLTYDVIRTGRKIWVSIYFEPIEDMISTVELLEIQTNLKAKLKEEFGDVYLELLPDIKPTLK